MSKFSFINLIDKVFVTICVFLLCFSWINFYIKNLWTTFILSLLFSFSIVFLLYYFLSKKKEKSTLTRKEINEMNQCFLAFRLMSKQEQVNLIKKLLDKQGFTQNPAAKKLVYNDDDGLHLIVLATHLTQINDDDLVNLINENYNGKYNCYDIYCNEVATSHTNLLKDTKIFFIDRKNLYEKLKAQDLCPSTDRLNNDVTKFKFKDFARSMFQPQKAKSYFLCGLVLIFSSIILPYNFYYIIFGSMLMLFAIICKILPKISPKS